MFFFLKGPDINQSGRIERYGTSQFRAFAKKHVHLHKNFAEMVISSD